MNARLPVLFGAGALFGLGLAVSGMADPARVAAFLDVAGAWDPALLFVMGGALGTFGLGQLLWRKRTHGRGWFGATLPACSRDPVDARLVTGALVFGIGWGLAGFCPGPALAGLAALRLEALGFVPAMAAGMLLARATTGADRS